MMGRKIGKKIGKGTGREIGKKIREARLGFAACVAFVFAFTASVMAASAPSLSASADADSAVKGQTVNVKVKLNGNPGITTVGLTLDYDSGILKYDGSTWNAAFSGSDMTMVSDNGGSLNISAVCDSVYTADGTVLTVSFKALSDTSEIPVTLELRDLSDARMETVDDYSLSSKVKTPDTGKTSSK